MGVLLSARLAAAALGLVSLAAVAQSAPASPADWLARVEALQPLRDLPDAEKELEVLMAQGLRQWPADVDVALAAARHKVWLADGTFDLPLKSRLGKEAWDLAKRVLAARPQSAAAHWYASRGVGAYAAGVSIVTALSEGLQGEFNRPLDFAVAHGPELDFGGPLIARGRYFIRLPWPQRDVRKGLGWLRDALKRFPQSLRARYLLAEALFEQGELEAAQRELAQVEQGAVDYDPPEGRRMKSWAVRLAGRMQEARR